jgi:hypothetical protein
MIRCGNGPRFLFETRTMRALEPLDGDDAVQTRIQRLSHFAHPARTDKGEDLVATELVARGKGHNAGLSEGLAARG